MRRKNEAKGRTGNSAGTAASHKKEPEKREGGPDPQVSRHPMWGVGGGGCILHSHLLSLQGGDWKFTERKRIILQWKEVSNKGTLLDAKGTDRNCRWGNRRNGVITM